MSAVHVVVDESVRAGIDSVAPVIRAHVEEAETARRLPKTVLDALAGAGLFRMLTPRSLGGLELHPVSCARVIEEVAGIDSAAGWTLMTANSVDWWCARLPADGAEELYADNRDAVITSAFHPPLEAVREDSGYRVSGRRPLASGIGSADWLMVTALVGDPGAEPGAIGLIVRATEAQVLDTWFSLGMRGTDSNDVVLDRVFVPESRTFAMPRRSCPTRTTGGRSTGCPRWQRSASSSRRWRSGSRGRCSRSSVSWPRPRHRSASPGSWPAAGWSSCATRAPRPCCARPACCSTTRWHVWEAVQGGEAVSVARRADLLLAATHAVASAVEVGDLLFGLAGTSAVYTRSRLERHFRDLQTLRHHGFASESRYETAGQVYFGLEPEFGMVTF